MDAHTLNVLSHVATGTLALLIGLVPMFSRKGGPLHRWSGRATVGLGAVVLGSAVIADILFDPPAPLVAATLSAGYQYLSGLRTLALKQAGPGWPDALLALARLGLVGLLGLHMGSGTASWPPAIGYATIGFIATIIVYDLSRHLWIATWRRHVRPLDHGVKMIGFWFAMLSAGAGNALEQWQPISQVLPSAIGMVAMVGFVIWYSVNPVGRRAMAAG